MFVWLKQLLCKHNFIDKCRVKTYNSTNYQDLCPSYQHNKCCRLHNEAYELLDGYCNYHYKKCSKCGKIKFIDF